MRGKRDEGNFESPEIEIVSVNRSFTILSYSLFLHILRINIFPRTHQYSSIKTVEESILVQLSVCQQNFSLSHLLNFPPSFHLPISFNSLSFLSLSLPSYSLILSFNYSLSLLLPPFLSFNFSLLLPPFLSLSLLLSNSLFQLLSLSLTPSLSLFHFLSSISYLDESFRR